MVRKTVFHFYRLALHPLPARCIKGCLRMKTEINRIHNYLDMPLRLHKSAHNSEWPDWHSVLRQKSRDNRMVRPLAALKGVDMIRIHREIMSPVLQGDTGPRYDNP